MPAPSIPGFSPVWVDEFNGPSNAPINASNWASITSNMHTNNNHEIQSYTASPTNAHLSGDGQLCVLPIKDPATGIWTSARLEGKHPFSCDPGQKMVFQAEIRLGNNAPAQQQGIWPAFWALGQDIRQNAGWPKCGEWDILELVNGSATNQGTLHYQNAGGQHQQFDGKTDFTRGNYHTWALTVDRTLGTFQQESLTWTVDGKVFSTVTGAMIGTSDQWADVAHKPFFPLLNVAVGGDFPNGVAGMQTPNGQTLGGMESGMQVRYVAVYKSGGGVARHGEQGSGHEL